MPPADYPPDLPARIKRWQIIVIVLVVAAAGFLGYAMLQRAGATPPADRGNWYVSLTTGAFALAVVLLVAQFILPAMLVEAGRRKLALQSPKPGAGGPGDAASLLGLFQTQLLVSAALLELAALVVIGAFLVEGYFKEYIGWVGALFILAVLGYQFPIQANVEQWIEEQRKLLAQDRKAAAGSA